MNGQANCRNGYVCDSRQTDGGIGSQGICVTDCRAPGVSCSSGTCNGTGYCF